MIGRAKGLGEYGGMGGNFNEESLNLIRIRGIRCQGNNGVDRDGKKQFYDNLLYRKCSHICF